MYTIAGAYRDGFRAPKDNGKARHGYEMAMKQTQDGRLAERARSLLA